MKQNKKNPTKTSWYGMKMTKKKKNAIKAP